MPEIGEIRKAREIGRNQNGKIIWHACETCGKARWVQIVKGKPFHLLCVTCANKAFSKRACFAFGPAHPLWRGGRTYNGEYIMVKVSPDSPYFPMAGKARYVLEHRLIMANKLGRCLLPEEKVHHKNGIKDDNKPENLELLSKANHDIYKQMCAHCDLRKEIRLLRWQINELTRALQEKLRI